MKIILVLVFLFSTTICFSQYIESNTFFIWEKLNIEDTENTGFMYQDCDFKKLLLQAVKLGIIRPYKNDSLEIRLSQEIFLKRINQDIVSNKIILKSKAKYQFDEIVEKKLLAISIYSTKGILICTFSYKELKENLFLENSEAMICLGEDLKIPLIEVFDNYSFKTEFLKRIKIE